MEKHDALKILFQCADQYYEKLCDNTLLIISAKGNVLRLVPPLVIEKEHVDEMIRILKKVL